MPPFRDYPEFMQEGASADRRGGDNKIQRLLFPLLQRRGIADAWANAEDARHEITAECHKLSDDAAFMSSLEAYLASNPIIRASFESVLAQLALAAGVWWQETSPILHPLSRRGWHIGRWLPTFLLVQGPLGRLVKDRNSPLGKRLRTKDSGLPLLCSARDAFHNDHFRRIRNGFAHWSFEWIDRGAESEVVIIHWETGQEEIRVSLRECEALHLLTFTVTEAINKELFVKPGR